MNDNQLELAKAREVIAFIDEKLFDLIKERVELVKKIVKIKQKEQMPKHDESIQNVVFTRARALALKAQIPPAIGEEIIKTLVQCAVLNEEAEKNQRPLKESETTSTL